MPCTEIVCFKSTWIYRFIRHNHLASNLFKPSYVAMGWRAEEQRTIRRHDKWKFEPNCESMLICSRYADAFASAAPLHNSEVHLIWTLHSSSHRVRNAAMCMCACQQPMVQGLHINAICDEWPKGFECQNHELITFFFFNFSILELTIDDDDCVRIERCHLCAIFVHYSVLHSEFPSVWLQSFSRAMD